MWEELRRIRDSQSRDDVRWIILGDFNVTLSSSEHSCSSDYMGDQTGMREFQEFVTDCEVTDLDLTGPLFTWWNNRELDPIGKKLDRVLVNASWKVRFPHAHAIFETNGISDHARCCVFSSPQLPARNYPFKFFNFIVAHPRFIEVASEPWQSTTPIFHSRSALSRFHQKLKLLKPVLRALNKDRYGEITNQTKAAFETLCEKQIQALLTPTS